MPLKTLLFGRITLLADRDIFHKVSLIAVFAPVGLGGDGLSPRATARNWRSTPSGAPRLSQHIRRAGVGGDDHRALRELFPDHRALSHGRRRLSRGQQAAVARGGRRLRLRPPDRLRPDGHHLRGQRLRRRSSALLPVHLHCRGSCPSPSRRVAGLTLLNLCGVKESVLIWVPIFFRFRGHPCGGDPARDDHPRVWRPAPTPRGPPSRTWSTRSARRSGGSG